VRLGRLVREAGVQLQALSSKDVRRTREVRRRSRKGPEEVMPDRQRWRSLVRVVRVLSAGEPATMVVYG
jgi:hypothetical protein